MTYQIIYHDDAKADLIDIATFYINEASVDIAKNVLDKIKAQLATLDTNPERCMNYPRLPIYKQLLIQKLPYKAYFMIKDEQVLIVRILHTSRNHNQLL